MATRMQQRRGTAAQWISTNNGNGPILAAGEIGYESDSNKFKIGDGVNHWVDLSYFLDIDSLGGSLDDYVPLTDLAQPLGVATLDGSGKLLASQVPNIDEISQDAINSALTAGEGIAKNYDDAANTLTISNTGVIALAGTANEVVVDQSSGEVVIGLAQDVEIAGKLTLSQAPEADLEAATKLYVDNVTSGINFHEAVKAATVSSLSASYSNGTDGVGATLTNTGDKAALEIDGVALSVDNRVLVKNQTDAKQNGIYAVTTVGSGSVNWVLTRTSDADNSPAGEFKAGDFTLVIDGTVNAGYGFVNSTPGTITIGTTNITYTAFNAGKTVVAGEGLWETSPGVIGIDDTVATLADAQTLTNKGIDFSDNTVTATLAELNAAVTDANLATIAGTETLLNKTLIEPTVETATISGATITGGSVDVPSLKLDGATVATASDLSTHASDTTNVHGIANTADLATQTYVNTGISTHSSDTTSVHGIADTAELATKTYADDAATDAATTAVGALTKSSVGLGNVDNTSDANKPVSTATQTALDAKAPLASPTFTGTVAGITKSMVGLGNVDNTADSAKPVSTAAQTALDLKAPLNSPTFTGTVAGITKSMVGLGNVDNTSDANKPVSTAAQTALDLKAPKEAPTFTGTLTAADVTISGNLTVSGTTTTVNTTNFTTSDPVIYLGEGNNANLVDIGFVGSYNDGTYAHQGLVKDSSDGKWKLFKGVTDEPTTTVNFAQGSLDALAVGAFTATSIAVGNVSNTEFGYLDGVTSAIQTQLDAKLASATASSTYAPLASPALTGTPTAPTAAALTNTTQVATTAYVQEDNKVAYVSVSGTSLTIAQATHMFKTVHCTSSSAVTVSIPTDASDNWPIGTYVNIRQMGTGQITVAAATPATTTVVATDSQFKSRVQYSEIVLEKIAANSWIVVGDTAA